jgi:hypothetical protein
VGTVEKFAAIARRRCLTDFEQVAQE